LFSLKDTRMTLISTQVFMKSKDDRHKGVGWNRQTDRGRNFHTTIHRPLRSRRKDRQDIVFFTESAGRWGQSGQFAHQRRHAKRYMGGL
jgi:hypothetical protein